MVLTFLRRILHWGPPKTVEEYYQQIGRAGRDGIESYCTMYCNSNDFDRYKDDFYLGGLSASVRANQEASIDSLKKFAMSEEVCRRAEILKFFHEAPSFGARCGTCDTCVSRRENGDDFERDFADSGARLLLHIISCITPSQGVTTINKIILGQKVEAYRLDRSVQNNQPGFLDMVKEMKSSMQGYKKRLPASYFTKDLLPALVDKGYVEVNSHTSNSGGYKAVSTNSYFSFHTCPFFLRCLILPDLVRLLSYPERKAASKQWGYYPSSTIVCSPVRIGAQSQN